MAILTWIDCQDRREMEQYRPCRQVYAVCFNDEGEILVIDEKGNGTWKIIGGTPMTGETPEETLARELMEEADVELRETIPLGVQKVEEYIHGTQNPRVYYQWRFAGRIARLHPQTPDPDNGRIYPRKFVPADRINEAVRWGDTGKALFAAAINLLKIHNG